MRVALVFEGLKPVEEAFSGTPWNLGRGFGELGHEPVFVRASAPWAIERSYRIAARRLGPIAHLEPELARLRSVVTAGRLRRVGEVDAIVQLGTGFRLPPHPRLATYEDMTVLQALRSDPAYAGMPSRTRETWVARQRSCYAAARACLTLSSWTADSIATDYGIADGKIAVIGAGRSLDPRPVERDWWPPRFLFVGLDWERKNGDGVLRAFGRLRERIPTARLDIVGIHPPLDLPGVSTHGRLAVRDPADRRRLEGLFEQATCFVMPSFAEPFGLVYHEAAAAGIPSVGTTAGGASDAVGDDGECVDPRDDEALLKAMLRLADGEVAHRIGAAAAARRDETTWHAVARRACEALGLSEQADPV